MTLIPYPHSLRFLSLVAALLASASVRSQTGTVAPPNDAQEQKARARQQIQGDAEHSAEQNWDKQQHLNGGGSDHPAINVEQQESRQQERLSTQTAEADANQNVAAPRTAKAVRASVPAHPKKTGPTPRDGGI